MNAFATHLPVVVITGGCGYRCQSSSGARAAAICRCGLGDRDRRYRPWTSTRASTSYTCTGGPPPRGSPPPTGSIGGDSVGGGGPPVGGGGVMVRSIAGGIGEISISVKSISTS